MEKFDAIIIGSGRASNPLAKKFSEEGRRVVLVESAFLGDTCVNYGCTSTKTLVSLAKNVTQAHRATAYGITLSNDIPNYETINQRKNQVVTDSRRGLEKLVLRDPNISISRIYQRRWPYGRI